LKDLIHEPQTALVSGKDGLDDIRIIIKQAPKHLTNNGFLLLEHGYNQQLKIGLYFAWPLLVIAWKNLLPPLANAGFCLLG
jgi:methylase of polypeptide subunit release factors